MRVYDIVTKYNQYNKIISQRDYNKGSYNRNYYDENNNLKRKILQTPSYLFVIDYAQIKDKNVLTRRLKKNKRTNEVSISNHFHDKNGLTLYTLNEKNISFYNKDNNLRTIQKENGKILSLHEYNDVQEILISRYYNINTVIFNTYIDGIKTQYNLRVSHEYINENIDFYLSEYENYFSIRKFDMETKNVIYSKNFSSSEVHHTYNEKNLLENKKIGESVIFYYKYDKEDNLVEETSNRGNTILYKNHYEDISFEDHLNSYEDVSTPLIELD